MNGVAFFDFDGTVLVKESTRLCAIPGVRGGFVRPLLGLRIAMAMVAYKLKLTTRQQLHRICFECYRSRSLDEIEPIIEVMQRDVMRRWFSQPMLDAIQWHRLRGHEVVLATASARSFVVPTARDLGIAHVLATELEFAGDVSTGQVAFVLDGLHKRDACVAFATGRGVGLADCWFYTDHIADLPLLEVVGHPVCVGPHGPLRALAARQGWEIVEHTRAPPWQPLLSASTPQQCYDP